MKFSPTEIATVFCSECKTAFEPYHRNDKRCKPCAKKRKINGSPNRPSKQCQTEVYIGIDGEGITDAFGKHFYVYMAAVGWNGEREVFRSELYRDDNRLTTDEILFWLWKLPKGSNWFYSSGYDWTEIFTDLPREVLRELYPSTSMEIDPERDSFKWVSYKCWSLKKIQGSVSLGKSYVNRDGKEFVSERFYQDGFRCWNGGPFVDKLEEWKIGNPEIWEEMRDMKNQRSHFSACDQSIRNYCLSECLMLAQLAHKITTTAWEKNIRPSKGQWYSAGSGAKSLMQYYSVVTNGYRGPDRYAGAPQEYVDHLMRAFFGGRFGISVAGLIDELHQYDLASAYPGACRDLPCLKCGHWEDGLHDGLAFGHIVWKPKKNVFPEWAPFPWRSPDGKTAYVIDGEGWYCKPEIDAAKRLGWYDIEEIEWFTYVVECDHKPFAWVQDLYDERLALGKNGPGLVLKVALNSTYGSIADTISAGSKYASVVWAAWITAVTRAKILDVIGEFPDAIAGIATDGIQTFYPLPIAERSSKKTLGDWDYEGVLKGVHLLQPGFMLADEGMKKPKSRGHHYKDVLDRKNELKEAWLKKNWDAKVKYQRTRFIPAKVSLSRNNFDIYGQWETTEITISLGPSHMQNGCGAIRGKKYRKIDPAVKILVFPDAPDLSSPYNKLVVLLNSEKDLEDESLNEDQP